MKASTVASFSSNAAARKPTAHPCLPSLCPLTSLLSSSSAVLGSPLFLSSTHTHCFVFVVLPLVVSNLSLVTYQLSYRMLPIIDNLRHRSDEANEVQRGGEY